MSFILHSTLSSTPTHINNSLCQTQLRHQNRKSLYISQGGQGYRGSGSTGQLLNLPGNVDMADFIILRLPAVLEAKFGWCFPMSVPDDVVQLKEHTCIALLCLIDMPPWLFLFL